MAMTWWRAYHGLPFDCKLAVIAKRCEARHGDVAAVWIAVLDYASQQADRGSVEGIDAEQIATVFGYEIEYVARIIEAFKQKGMVQGDRVSAWEKRQVLRERDDNSTQRVRAHRQREHVALQSRAAISDMETPCNANGMPTTPLSQKETPSDSDEESDEIHTRTDTQTRIRAIAQASSVNRTTNQRFDEFWHKYPRKMHKGAARRQFLGIVTTQNEVGMFECLDRYLASGDVARGAVMNPEKWLQEQARDDWIGEWPAPRGAPSEEDGCARAVRGEVSTATWEAFMERYADTGKPLNEQDWLKAATEATTQGLSDAEMVEQVMPALHSEMAEWADREVAMIPFPANWLRSRPWTRRAKRRQQPLSREQRRQQTIDNEWEALGNGTGQE